MERRKISWSSCLKKMRKRRKRKLRSMMKKQTNNDFNGMTAI